MAPPYRGFLTLLESAGDDLCHFLVMNGGHSDGWLAELHPADVAQVDPDQVPEAGLDERPGTHVPVLLLAPDEP